MTTSLHQAASGSQPGGASNRGPHASSVPPSASCGRLLRPRSTPALPNSPHQCSSSAVRGMRGIVDHRLRGLTRIALRAHHVQIRHSTAEPCGGDMRKRKRPQGTENLTAETPRTAEDAVFSCIFSGSRLHQSIGYRNLKSTLRIVRSTILSFSCVLKS